MIPYARIDETAYRIMDGSEVMYLTVLGTAHIKDRYIELFQAEPTREFYGYIADNMNAILNGKRVAEAIEPVLLNLVDDKINGRKMVLRAGDYIVLQNAFRATKGLS